MSSEAACIFGEGRAGQNAAYHYAVAYINSTISAETGLKRVSKVAKGLKPAEDYQSALASCSGALKEYELAARDLECAASIIEPQEKISFTGQATSVQKQMKVARTTAATARFLYLQLADEIRAMASIFVRRMRGDITDVDFAEQAAKVSANMHDIPRDLFALSPSVTLVLIQPEPDSADKMSRLNITAKERDDLINMLDKGFGQQVIARPKAISVPWMQSPRC